VAVRWGKPALVILALPLPFWNDWNDPIPVLHNTYRYRLERSMERSRVDHRQAWLLRCWKGVMVVVCSANGKDEGPQFKVARYRRKYEGDGR
jgi:hypothetical protein